MSGQRSIIGKYAVAADNAVVGNMHIGHNEVVVADNRFARSRGTAVYRAAFADDIVVANLDSGVLAVELQILRDGGYDGTWKDLAVLTDTGSWKDCHIRTNPRVVADDDILIYGGEI